MKKIVKDKSNQNEMFFKDINQYISISFIS